MINWREGVWGGGQVLWTDYVIISEYGDKHITLGLLKWVKRIRDVKTVLNSHVAYKFMIKQAKSIKHKTILYMIITTNATAAGTAIRDIT